MSLKNKIIGKMVKGYMKATNKDVRYMIESGQWTDADMDRIINEALEETDAKYKAKSPQSRQTASGCKCCSNCRHFSWGECWYYYEGHPGFNYNSSYRPDYHGETREISYPDSTVCNGYEKKY